MKLPFAEHRRIPVSELLRVDDRRIGKANLTLFQHIPTGHWFGVIRKGTQTCQFFGGDKDQVVAEMEAECSPPPPLIKGYKGAIERFLHLYPGGFDNAAFLKGERGGKLEAGRLLAPLYDLKLGDDEAVSVVKSARALLSRGGQSPLHMTESSDLDRAWSGPAKPTYVRALRAMAGGDRSEGFRLMRRSLEGLRCSWPMVTIFPALLNPVVDAVLRPEAVKTYARAVRSAFAEIYESEPNLAVYEEYLRLLDKTAKEITVLNPRDYVDLSSFVWVVTSYSASEAPR